MQIEIDSTDLDCFRVDGCEGGSIHVRGSECFTFTVDDEVFKCSVAGLIDFLIAVNKEEA